MDYLKPDTLLKSTETGVVKAFEFWCVEYQNRIGSWETLNASQLVHADIILKVLVEVN